MHEELDEFDIRINPFGEIQTSYDIDKLNAFLNSKIDDKKLKDHPKEKGDEGENEENDS